MKKYWFRPKRYGYGFYPISLLGWLTILFTCLLVIMAFYVDIPFKNGKIYASSKDWCRFIIDYILISSVYCILVKDKVEGGIKWRWGKR